MSALARYWLEPQKPSGYPTWRLTKHKGVGELRCESHQESSKATTNIGPLDLLLSGREVLRVVDGPVHLIRRSGAVVSFVKWERLIPLGILRSTLPKPWLPKM